MKINTDTTEYQKFVRESAFHREAVRKLFEPIGVALDDVADEELKDAALDRLSQVMNLFNQAYSVLGLCGEVGEVADKFKKVIRDGDGAFPGDTLKGIQKELGDAEWYLTDCAVEFGSDKDTIIGMNHTKLVDRFARGKRSGSGDDR